MRKIIFIVAALCSLGSLSYSQNTDYIKRPTLGVHFFFDDFNTASAIRSTSVSHVLNNKQWSKIKDMTAGLSLRYVQGLTNHLDFSGGLSGSFLDYPLAGKAAFGSDNLLLEADAMIHAKMLTDKYVFVPYLSGGIGASKYKGYYGAFIPVGTGFQFNIFDEAFIFVDAQYRMRVTETTNYHFYYSLGLAGNIGKPREPKAVLPPPPPPVAVVIDRDGDGVVDSLDACPDVAGLAEFKGCPDTDKDGIADNEDKCPQTPGIARYQGCPIPDTDKDGINDEEDKCKDQAGFARYQGCPIPDRDNDGVNDEEDKCPDLAGVASNFGCPEIKDEIRKRVDVAAKQIYFVTGSYKLLPKSFPKLNDVVKIFNEDANLKLDVDGHTDNVGKPEKNQVLSQQRADAVKAYLVKKGVSEARITSTGYGQDRPIGDNKTKAGKASNRRVELKLHYN